MARRSRRLALVSHDAAVPPGPAGGVGAGLPSHGGGAKRPGRDQQSVIRFWDWLRRPMRSGVRLPRVRLRLWWLMVLIGAIAVFLGAWIEVPRLRELSRIYRSRANHYAELERRA